MANRLKSKYQSMLRGYVVDWLNSGSRHPDGLALDVGTRFLRDKVDIGAIWFKTNTTKNSFPQTENFKGAMFICCINREECWPECANAEQIAKQIGKLRQRREDVEAEIRSQEPELRDTQVLFEELSLWNYELTSNREYHELQSRIAELEDMLYRGTRMEHVSNNPLAEELYMVVPEGTLDVNELREDWGLIQVKYNECNVLRKAKKHNVLLEDKTLFLKRMFSANTSLVENYLRRKNGKKEKGKNI